MTEKTLLDTRIVLAGDALVHHREMHHEVAGRRLMTLVAVLRFGRGVQKASDLPGLRLVAICTKLAEQGLVLIAEAVAGSAVQHLALDGSFAAGDGRQEMPDCGRPWRRRLPRDDAGMGRTQADLGEYCVVHRDRTHIRAPVFQMAISAFLDRSVERGRLLGEHDGIGRVARDAGCRLDAPVRRVTTLALRLQKGVRSGQRTRTGDTTPERKRWRA